MNAGSRPRVSGASHACRHPLRGSAHVPRDDADRNDHGTTGRVRTTVLVATPAAHAALVASCDRVFFGDATNRRDAQSDQRAARLEPGDRRSTELC
jgi:hypothetical protein